MKAATAATAAADADADADEDEQTKHPARLTKRASSQFEKTRRRVSSFGTLSFRSAARWVDCKGSPAQRKVSGPLSFGPFSSPAVGEIERSLTRHLQALDGILSGRMGRRTRWMSGIGQLARRTQIALDLPGRR